MVVNSSNRQENIPKSLPIVTCDTNAGIHIIIGATTMGTGLPNFLDSGTPTFRAHGNQIAEKCMDFSMNFEKFSCRF